MLLSAAGSPGMIDLRRSPLEASVRTSLLSTELDGLERALSEHEELRHLRHRAQHTHLGDSLSQLLGVLEEIEQVHAEQHARRATVLSSAASVMLANERLLVDTLPVGALDNERVPFHLGPSREPQKQPVSTDAAQQTLPESERRKLAEIAASLVQQGVWRGSQATFGNANLPSETDVWVGAGEARPGEPLTRDHAVRWSSMTKVLCVLFLAWLIDLGKAPDPDASIGDTIPEFALDRLRVRTADGGTEPARRPITWEDVIAMKAPFEYESFLWGGDKLASRANHGPMPQEPKPFHYSRGITDAAHGVFPAKDATAFYGCWKGVAGTRTERVKALAAAPLQHQPGTRDCSYYGPQHALLGMAFGVGQGKPNQRFVDAVLRPAGISKLWFDHGQTKRVEGVPLTELAFRYHHADLPQGRRDKRCADRGKTYFASECPNDGWTLCDERRMTARETTAGEGKYDGVLDVGAVAPFSEMAKVLRLIHSGGVAEDGTRVVSAAALRIALQPVTDCGCFKYAPGQQCEVGLTEACRGDYWGLGACMLSGVDDQGTPTGPTGPTVGQLLRELKSLQRHGGDHRAAVAQVAAGLQNPARIGWGNWFGAQFVLDMTTGVFLIGGNGAQPDAYDLHMFPWYSHYLPWFDRAVSRAKRRRDVDSDQAEE